ncbi:MAG: hypothetical protein E7Z80_05995 [Methanobrevibacter thaueri]|nr:hypothetical protein [Methanobrevibacter thaueri]
MEFKNKKITRKQKQQAILCIGLGTGVGLIVYEIFLFFKIAIFGWNLGLIFAPLIAGYVETICANKLIGDNIGAISAFILFIDTTFYSFILKNPTLGWNFITAGSIIVILQAAFPTLVNYILLVVIGGVLSNFIKQFKKYANIILNKVKNQNIFKWEGENPEELKVLPEYNELLNNLNLNNQDFYFITSSDMTERKHEIMGIYQSEVFLKKNTSIITSDPEEKEQERLINIKKGKDECLIKLADKIKENGGNGIVDLSINYSLSGDCIRIITLGMGIKIN